MSSLLVKEFGLIDQFRGLSLTYEMKPRSVFGMMRMTNSVLEEIKESHMLDKDSVGYLASVNQGKGVDFIIDKNGILKFRDRTCVRDVLELNKRVLEENHKRNLSIHPGATEMYQDLK